MEYFAIEPEEIRQWPYVERYLERFGIPPGRMLDGSDNWASVVAAERYETMFIPKDYDQYMFEPGNL